MFAQLVPSRCDKSGTSCYHPVTCLMTVTDLLQAVPTRLTQVRRNKLPRACCHQLANNLWHTDDIRRVGTLKLLRLASLLVASSTLLSRLRTSKFSMTSALVIEKIVKVQILFVCMGQQRKLVKVIWAFDVIGHRTIIIFLTRSHQ